MPARVGILQDVARTRRRASARVRVGDGWPHGDRSLPAAGRGRLGSARAGRHEPVPAPARRTSGGSSSARRGDADDALVSWRWGRVLPASWTCRRAPGGLRFVIKEKGGRGPLVRQPRRPIRRARARRLPLAGSAARAGGGARELPPRVPPETSRACRLEEAAGAGGATDVTFAAREGQKIDAHLEDASTRNAVTLEKRRRDLAAAEREAAAEAARRRPASPAPRRGASSQRRDEAQAQARARRRARRERARRLPPARRPRPPRRRRGTRLPSESARRGRDWTSAAFRRKARRQTRRPRRARGRSKARDLAAAVRAAAERSGDARARAWDDELGAEAKEVEAKQSAAESAARAEAAGDQKAGGAPVDDERRDRNPPQTQTQTQHTKSAAPDGSAAARRNWKRASRRRS